MFLPPVLFSLLRKISDDFNIFLIHSTTLEYPAINLYIVCNMYLDVRAKIKAYFSQNMNDMWCMILTNKKGMKENQDWSI